MPARPWRDSPGDRRQVNARTVAPARLPVPRPRCPRGCAALSARKAAWDSEDQASPALFVTTPERDDPEPPARDSGAKRQTLCHCMGVLIQCDTERRNQNTTPQVSRGVSDFCGWSAGTNRSGIGASPRREEPIPFYPSRALLTALGGGSGTGFSAVFTETAPSRFDPRSPRRSIGQLTLRPGLPSCVIRPSSPHCSSPQR